MKIKLTADTRVLLSAGTIVEVSKETATAIKTLGRCEILAEAKAEKKAEVVAEEPGAEAEAPAPKKKATKKKD